MNRWAKFFRTVGGIFLLADLAVMFLPFMLISQENYSDISYSQFDFIKMVLNGDVSKEKLLAVGILIILPAVLALIFGIIGIVSGEKQIISGIGSIIVSGLNIAFLLNMKLFEPERINDAQVYKKDIAFWALAGITAVFLLCGMISFFVRPRRLKRKENQEVIYQQEKDSSENIADSKKQIYLSEEDEKKIPEPLPEVNPVAQIEISPLDVTQPLDGMQTARGVMVGLSGDYKGAEIPFKAGETLKIGRAVTNDLIFSEAERISRFHCAITWIPEMQKYQIVDTSSNGSFINEMEECIPQNIAIYLEPGTILDLGNKENRFRLE